MIKISPFSPLFFSPSTDKYGVESRHIQLFATEDNIVVQVLADGGESVSGVLKNIISDAVTEINFSKLKMSSTVMVYTATLSQLSSGYYSIAVNDIESDIFHVTDDQAKLECTSLIKYTSSTNRLRSDVVFVNGSEQYEFMFRVPGGFKDNDWAFQVNNEQFETADGNIVELFAVESTAKTFTMGDSYGCPIWFGEHLNRILCCTHVHINGVRYVRKGSSTPEVTQELPGQKSYIFKVQLQGMVENVNIELPSSSEDDSESEGGGIGYVYLIKVGDDTRATDSNTYSALRIAYEIEKAIKENNAALNEKFIRKDMDDRTPFRLAIGDKATMEKGLQLGKNFAPGILTGFGGYFDEYGNGEIESLIIRRFLEVPELRFNRVQVSLGDKWNAPGAGIVESVVPDYNADGSIASTGTVYLKLEEGEYGAVAVGDICMGIFHSEVPSENATEDYDDSRGNFMFAGFYTAYFTITEITGKNNGQFKYQMRPVSDRWKLTLHPRESMHFVCYGSFLNTSRQTSVYTTRTYTRLLKNQNTWEISAANLAMQWGDLTNMNIHGMDMSGYSVYLNNIYMTGVFKQVKPDGTPVKTVNERGKWMNGETYAYYDRVSHNGGLWLCVNESGTNSEPSKYDPAWLLEVKSGASVTSYGPWNTKNTPFKANSIVTFFNKVWISNKETSEAPFPIYTDNEGNRLLFNDGGYIIASLVQSEDWNLLLDAPSLTNGADGKSLQLRYSSDKTSWHDVYATGDVWLQQRVGEDAQWSDPIPFVGEAGKAGKDGTYYDYQFAVNDSLTDAPTSGWQDTPPAVGEGQYLWLRTRLVDPNTSEENPWSVARVGGEKGDKGDSVSNMGAWKTGMAVPYLGLVTMGGRTFMAKVATNNPPLWCYTDKDGNRLLFSDGGYVLTGEINTAEYDLVMQNGKDGKDGKGNEYIYIHTMDNNRPSTPISEQIDDYVPSGWHDDPIGVTATLPYEWVSMRTKKDGIWSDYSTPGIWAKYAMDAILADLDNEMDNIAITSDGVSTSESTIAITASMYYGSTRQALTSINVGSIPGIISSYVLNTGVVTLKVAKGATFGDRTEIPISVTASINGKEETRTLKFTLAAIRGGANAVMYDIVTSVSAIGKRKDGSYSVSGVSATRMKTIGNKSSETTDGTLKYSIDDGSEVEVGNNVVIASNKIGSKIQFTFYNADGVVVDKESVPMVIDGSDGEGFTMMGNWRSGLAVPKMGVVTMGGCAFAAKVATTNPPLWCYTDRDGNRLLFSDGGYILTGDVNTEEYDLWVQNGRDGKDGIGKDGAQGIQGCIMLSSEWALNTEYRNDEALTSGTRYINTVLVRNDATETGWDAFKCKKTHVSSAATAPPNTTYWEEYGANVNGIFTSFILAKNAKIRFLQGNQLLMQKSNGMVTAGLSGSEEGDKTRIWAGSETPDTAPFRVDESGKLVATRAEITGEVNATSGIFENVKISGSIRTPWKELIYKRIYSSSTMDIYGFDGSAYYDDKIEVYPVVSCELYIGWGDLANGREVAIRVNSTNNSQVYIVVPSGYFAIDYEGNLITEGNKLYLHVGYIHYLTGCKDCWVVNRRTTIVGNK